ncbi:uncharacterized protein LOC110990798 isoform X2 [Acanthaster planci]|uniref:Uncharacterized protein LOC110990798 isoform X2 n=1 Tax=Acanthaster planci TaxID=133434 RepID=A0A8B8A1G8_ACAPL|nr:uncharacterized protein LOC110990798 isoform X2 [Acanthaster planci]
MAPIGNVTSTDDLSPSYSATMAPYSVTSAQYEPTFYTTLAPTSAGFGLSECMDWLTLVCVGVGVTIGVVYAIWRRRRGCNRSRQQQQHGPVQLTDMPGKVKIHTRKQ